MHLKRIAMSRIENGDFVIYESPFPNETHPFRFQYSGTVANLNRGWRQFELVNPVIEKFNRKGDHVRTTHEYSEASPPLLFEMERGAVVFKVMQ
jgi:hypothetical protein